MERVNFTGQKLDKLPTPPKGERYSYADKKINGLIIRVTHNGHKSFQIYKKWQGRPIRVTLGKYPDLSIENARKEAYKVMGQFTVGKNPNTEKQKIRQDLTLKQAFEEYLDKHAKKHKKTWDYDDKQFKRYLTNLQNKRLSTITRQEVERLHKKIGEENGIYSANRLLSLLKTMFNKAIQWGWEGSNPAQGVKKYKEKSRDRFLQSAELPKFFKALNQETSITIKDYIFILLLTGARRGNVLSMSWDEIDFKRAIWRIPETKNGEPLDIPLVDEAINILKRRKRDANSEWVFPSVTSQSGHLEESKRVWQRVLENSGIKDLRIHDIRRTLGSYQAITGASSLIIGKTLGHKSQQATQVYSRLNSDPIEKPQWKRQQKPSLKWEIKNEK